VTGEVAVEDGTTGCYWTVDEAFTEVGDEELHCLRGLAERVESWGGVVWDVGDFFFDHCDEFVAGAVDVGEAAVLFY